MNLVHWIGTFLGTAVFSPWSQWWNSSTGPDRMPQGTPPMDYNQLTQQQLLASFSDSIGPSGITPRSLRNFVASTVTSTPGGAPPTIPLMLPGWTTATRPNGAALAGPAIGYNYTLRQIDMWDDQLQQWVNPSFQGGLVAGATTFAGPVTFDSPVVVDGQLTTNDYVLMTNMVSSPGGLQPGIVWNNGNVLSVIP